MINQDCVRALICLIDNTQQSKSHGNKKPWKLKQHLSDQCLQYYEQQEIFDAAKYLWEKKLIDIAALDPAKAHLIAPKAYVVLSVTALGQDYLSAVKKDATWEHLKKFFGDTAKATISSVITEAVKFVSFGRI